MKRNQLEKKVLKLLLIDCGLILFSQMISLEGATSCFFYLLFPLTALTWLMNLPKKWALLDTLIILAAVLACVHTGINCIQMNGMADFFYFKKVVFFVTSLLFLQVCHHRKLDYEETDFVYKWTSHISTMFIVMFFLQGTDRYLIDGKVSRYLTLGFSNPNLLALFLSCFIMIECSGFFRNQTEKSRKYRLYRVLALGFLVLETQARNSEIVLVIYLVMLGLLYISQKKFFSCSKLFALVIGFFPMLFFAAYMLFIENPLIQGVFGFMAGIGKKLNSRVKMWTTAWEYFVTSPLIGAYYQMSDGTGFAQMHNTHLDTAVSYGFVVMILLGVIFSMLLFQKQREYADKRRVCCMIGFAGTILLGMGETAMLVGSLGIFVIMGLLLLLANGEVIEEDLDFQGESFKVLKDRMVSSDVYRRVQSLFEKMYSLFKRIKVKS